MEKNKNNGCFLGCDNRYVLKELKFTELFYSSFRSLFKRSDPKVYLAHFLILFEFVRFFNNFECIAIKPFPMIS